MAASFTVPRMYSNEAGECRFDAYDVLLSLQEAAPPAAPFFIAAKMDATSYTFFASRPVGLAISIRRRTQGS
jgi:hypothetical protein